MIRPALIALALLLPWPAVAGGESSSGFPDRPERPTVGSAQDLRIDPDLTNAEPFGDGLRWRQVVQVEGAAFLKPRFLNFNLAPGDTLVVRSASGRVVETLQGRGPKDAGSFWGLSSFGDRLELELLVRTVGAIALQQVQRERFALGVGAVVDQGPCEAEFGVPERGVRGRERLARALDVRAQERLRCGALAQHAAHVSDARDDANGDVRR